MVLCELGAAGVCGSASRWQSSLKPLYLIAPCPAISVPDIGDLASLLETGLCWEPAWEDLICGSDEIRNEIWGCVWSNPCELVVSEVRTCSRTAQMLQKESN